MTREVHIQEIRGPTAAEADVEIVERKGLGHPDTICDLVMERTCQALCRAYTDRIGRILHHNCDKGLLVAGQVERRFSGGRVIEPMRLVIGDRATLVKEFDVHQLAVETAKRWFRENLPRVDPERHLTYQVELKGGSQELTGIFQALSASPVANDSSAAVGYAPLSPTEMLVLETERFLNGATFKKLYPESGQDVKVLAVREGEEVRMTVAMPLLAEFILSEQAYFQKKEEMREALTRQLQPDPKEIRNVRVEMNTLDRQGTGLSGIYLSLLGTSAEDADSGEVGRGNRVNGLIALNRPRGSEAAPGKNPVSHVGKIYNVLTHLMAERIYSEVSGLRQVVVWLSSRIGDPVDRPQMVSIQIACDRMKFSDVEAETRRIVSRELDGIPAFCRELASGKYPVC